MTRPIAIAAALLALASAGCTRKHATAQPADRTEHGRQVYTKLCATCHGPQANGYAADNAPSLRTATFLASATDKFLRDGITLGRPGTSMAGYGRGVGGPLSPDEVNDVVAFLRAGAPAPAAPPPEPAAKGDPAGGKILYGVLCQRCHGTPQQRSTAVHLANPTFLAAASDGFLRFAIESGRPPTSMIPWKETLKPKQIDDLVAYVRSLAVAPAQAAAPAQPPAAPRRGPIVLNARGRAPDFKLKDDFYVGIDQVKQALDDKRRLIIADARPPSDYETLHITGAISTPYYDAKSLDDLPNDGTWVLAYCACPHHVSGEVVQALRKRGFKHTAVIDEGIFAWQQKGYPVVAAPAAAKFPAPPPPPPQPHR